MIVCGRRVRDAGYYACAHIVRRCGDRPSLAALQELNESTVLVNQQQGYSKLPKYVRKSDAGSHRDIRGYDAPPNQSISTMYERRAADGFREHYGAI